MTGLSLRAAEIEHDMHETKRENERGPGQEWCSHCGEPHDEGDLYRLGGDWMCVPCIVGTDLKTSIWKSGVRSNMRVLIALLRIRELTPTCKRSIEEAEKFLGGARPLHGGVLRGEGSAAGGDDYAGGVGGGERWLFSFTLAD